METNHRLQLQQTAGGVHRHTAGVCVCVLVCLLTSVFIHRFCFSLQILKNPIVFMVIVGILFHFLFGGRVPVLLSEFVDGLANSFGGAALFYLGLNMVGQMRKLTRAAGVSLILLITAKL